MKNYQSALWYGFAFFLMIAGAGGQDGFCQNSPASTTIEGGLGLLYTQSAHTYGVGQITLGMKSLVMDKETMVRTGGTLLKSSDYSTLLAVPITFGLTDEVDLTASFYGYNNSRVLLNLDEVNAGYGQLIRGIGASRFGIKLRLPFRQESPIQIAGKFGALVSTSEHQLDGLNYRWTRTDTDIEASLLETFDLGAFLSLSFEQGYVLSGTELYDDQLIGAAGIQFRMNDRLVMNLEAVNRTFLGSGLQSAINAAGESWRFSDPGKAGNIRYLLDTKPDYDQDFLIVAPSIAFSITPHMTFDLGVLINLADNAKPSETIQGVVGLTFRGGIMSMIDSDFDGVNNRRDQDRDTPLGYPVDRFGVPLDSDRDGVPDGADEELHTLFGARVNAFGIGRDSDGDGVYDGLDMEPETLRGIPVDENGVALDGDRDGVPDALDHEPKSALGAVVNAEGVALDGDGDGIPDGIDREPNTIHGALVDSHGVALDSDEDGVPDGVDQEPNTPRGISVDAVGRTVIRQEYSLFNEGMIRLNSITFAAGSSAIDPSSFSVLDEIGTLLRKYPYLRIQIGGHTDNLGDQALNYRVSRERALAVRDYLLMRFPDITVDRLQAVGFGSDKPIATNNTAEGRNSNRRVEFIIINQDEPTNMNRK